MSYWLLLAVFCLTAVLLFTLTRPRFAQFALDAPNERSLHSRLTPRTGGLALMAGVLAGWLLLDIPIYWLVLPLALISLSLVDDIRGLPARWRFLGQTMVCAVFLMIQTNGLEPWLMGLLLIAMVWMVNLYNFMDGSDGLAGGMAVFGFSTYAAAAYLGFDIPLAMMNASIVAAAIAFLLFNFNPARIFMGDAGSVPLGFLVAAIGFYGWQKALWPSWFPLLVFSPFIVDATVTLLKRLIRREKIWQAHKSHYYQRLVQIGWGHKKTAIVEYVLMMMASLSAIYTLQYPGYIFYVLGLWAMIYLVLTIVIDLVWRAKKPANPH